MTAEITTALISLALIIIGSLGTLIKAMVDRVLLDLAKNTTITTQAKDAANGRLESVQRELAKERDRSLALREIVRERDDRLSYIVSRLPQARHLMVEYGRRRQDRRSPTEEMQVLTRILEEDVDDPTGSDAGRFSPN